MFCIVVMENFGCADFVSNPGAEYSIYGKGSCKGASAALDHRYYTPPRDWKPEICHGHSVLEEKLRAKICRYNNNLKLWL